ncbi:tetratricopeptide repeat protein [Salinisphaera sp. T31B1]|uniref:tetratricopeptide repeat protein n=1 Tax=Salinisphaera sp. T31B1 TaxID=727963 RepID=UPI0033423BC5
MRPAALVIITIVLGVALILLFPARQFISLTHSDEGLNDPGGISIPYLQALLKANPDDRALRLNLAERQLEAGQVTAANQTLDALPPEDDADIRWLRLEAAWQAFNAAPADSAERAARRTQLEARMRAADPAGEASDTEEEEEEEEAGERSAISNDRLQSLAERWLALGEPARAAADYERLAAQDAPNTYDWHALAARWWLAAGRPLASARSWRRAFEIADTPPRRRDAALAALGAARQAPGERGLDLAREMVDAFGNDPMFLDIGIDMALANDQLALAERWSAAYVGLRPDDPKALERDTRIALAMNRIDDALAGLTELVQRHPDDVSLRAQLAEVQVWAGRPEAALANYERLAVDGASDVYDNRVIELAGALHDSAAVLRALDRIRGRHPLNATQRSQLVDILDAEGDPDRAIAVIRQWIDHGPADRALWVRMATLQEQTGDLDGALTSWQRLGTRFGVDVTGVLARSRLLTKLWRIDDAFAVLRDLPDPPARPRSDEALYYWSRLGDLAWMLEDKVVARDSYATLLRAERLDANGALRLAQSAVDTGAFDQAMAATRSDWREHRHAEMVTLMLGLAQRARRPQASRELLGLAEAQPELFADSVDYWRLYGDYYFNTHDLDRARSGYLKALALAPGDPVNRSALLYTLAESGRTDELAGYVRRWRAAASSDPGQWQAFAMAYSQLGQARAALPWYDRAIRRDPDNYLLALDYADALTAGRRFESARRMREYAVRELRPRLMADLNRQGVLDTQQRREDVRILGVQAAMLGPDANRGWLRLALGGRRGAGLDAADIEMLLGYYLAQEQPAYSRYWLLRAQRRRVATEDWQRMAVALQNDDQVEIDTILRELGPSGGTVGISDRISALRQLDLRARALTLALDHERPNAPYAAGVDVVPRYAAELYQQMPQYYGSQLSIRRISDLDITGERLFFRLSGERLSARVDIGARQLTDRGIDVDLNGLSDERFADLELNWRERRGVTTVRVGTVTTDAWDTVSLGARQTWRLTDHVTGEAFVDYNRPADETGQLRVLGVRDEIGATLDWTLNGRDSASLTATYQRFHSRNGRDPLADGYQIEAAVAHSLMVGPTHQFQIRSFATTEQNQLENALPASVADRLPDGAGIEDVVPERYSFVGAGVTFARGIPGESYPLVASPRYRIDLDGGYVLPDGQFGVSTNFAVGSRVLGSDELSFALGIDQTGSDTRQNSYTAMVTYQYFLGR